METSNPVLPAGYSPLAPGMIANVVTCLEMTARPASKGAPHGKAGALSLRRWEQPDPGRYRDLYRRVGTEWMWFSRLFMSDETLRGIIQHPDVQVYSLEEGEREIGLLELDFRDPGQCELAFFGVVPEAIGKGAGRYLMERAIELAWSRPINRFWVHTCTLDHPSALGFYQRFGFRPYRMMVEVHRDPRLTGHLPRDAAPHVALIEG